MRLIDADALPTHKQLEAMGNGQYEDVEIVYRTDIDNAPTIDDESALLYLGYGENWKEFKSKACEEAIKALSAEAVPQLKQTDTLIIADALRYLAKDEERHLSDRTRADSLRQQFLKYGASMCSSADAEQGEWIDKEIPCNPYPPVFFVECSECGYRVGRETFQENTFNYCPNCGALMMGGE